jgi:S-adenosylmethionine:tRNA-ribosyltransferase-isomerase (queuine synthetase)
MPDTRSPHDATRETVSQNAREAVSQTEDAGRRIIEAGAETIRCTAQADTESARRAVDVSTEPTRRAMETGADSNVIKLAGARPLVVHG